MTTRRAYTDVDGVYAERTAVVLHGILGSGRNWRSLARRLVALRPEWRVRLVDQRCHGASADAPGPHTVRAAAADVGALGPAEVVIGHSFGGKVALQLLAAPFPSLRQIWALDANPGAGGRGDTDTVLQAIASVSIPASSRAEVRAQLQGAGIGADTTGWLLTSLRRGDDGWHWVWNLAGIAHLIDDFRKQDLWPLLERATVETHLVAAGKSDVWPAVDQRRARELATLHVLPDAGHWLHADDPEALVALLSEELPR